MRCTNLHRAFNTPWCIYLHILKGWINLGIYAKITSVQEKIPEHSVITLLMLSCLIATSISDWTKLKLNNGVAEIRKMKHQGILSLLFRMHWSL